MSFFLIIGKIYRRNTTTKKDNLCSHKTFICHATLQQQRGFVPKVSVLIFYLNVYWTHLKLQVISFKV